MILIPFVVMAKENSKKEVKKVDTYPICLPDNTLYYTYKGKPVGVIIPVLDVKLLFDIIELFTKNIFKLSELKLELFMVIFLEYAKITSPYCVKSTPLKIRLSAL